MHRVARGLFLLSLILTGLSYAGGVHGLADSLAVFRYWFAMAMMGSAALLLQGRLRVIALVLLVAGYSAAPHVARLTAATPAAESYRIYQKNLLYNGATPRDIAADVEASGADFVTLEEVYRLNKVVLDALAPSYPTRLDCTYRSVAGLAILSRWPAVPQSAICNGENGLAAIQVTTPDGPVWIVAIHFSWPWPYPQPRQVAGAAPVIAGLDGPVIVGGDFNMVPWSHAVRTIERASRSRRAGPVVRSLHHAWGLLRLPIDHVLVPGGKGRLQVRPRLGSDHLGLLVSFDL